MSTRNIYIQIELSTPTETKRCQLEGYAYLDSGFLAGQLRSTQGWLSKSELLLLSGFTFTGCPIAARTTSADANPWVLTNGSYDATRIMRSNAFRVDSSIHAEGDDRKILMALSVHLCGTLPELAAIGPAFQEKIEQEHVNQLSGRFDLDFIDAAGRAHNAISDTKYRLLVHRDVPTVWRNITILDSPTSDSMLQVEQIDMFTSEADAVQDLLAKRSASASLLPTC